MKDTQRRAEFVWAIRVFACSLLLCSALCVAQDSECASISRVGNDIILTADSWDPVAAIGQTLADKYGVSVSVEAPKWDFPGDAEDVAVSDPEYSATHNHIHYQVMKRHIVRVRFPATPTSVPNDVPVLLRQLAAATNKEMPYAYRLAVSGSEYALVPTKTRNSAGEVQEVRPLLDRHVTIPEATRPIAEHARLLAEQLSQQTGLHIGCCQTFVAGIPWGRAKVPFGANDKPAREVLKALIQLEHETNMQSRFDHWVVRCDGTGAPWCFIDLAGRFNAHCNSAREQATPKPIPDTCSEQNLP